MSYQYDIIVIGAGAAGLTASIGLAKAGKKVLLVEKDQMGGECTNSGCIPSKSLIHHANIGTKKPLEKTRETIKKVRDHEEPKVLEKIKNLSVELGSASFVDKNTIKLTINNKRSVQYSSKKIIIATGSFPKVTTIEGLSEKDILTNQNIFEIKQIPKNLIILGGGPIGCEMAEAFNTLGSNVAIISSSSNLLPREELEISRSIESDFKSKGIKIITNASIEKCIDGYAYIKKERLKYDNILISIGRQVNLKSLYLNNANIHHTEKGIDVDSHYRTNQKNIFAIGDCNPGPKFSHIADDSARHVIKKILIPFQKNENKPNPRVTYLSQEVASTGITHKEALIRYSEKDILKIHIPYTSTDRSITDELTAGEAIMIVKRISGKILGASLSGSKSGEIISSFNIAIQNNISAWKLNNTIYAYPTQAQIIKKLTDNFVQQSISNLKKDILHRLKHALPKIIAISFWILIIYSFHNYKSSNQLANIDVLRQIMSIITNSSYGPLIYVLFYFLRPITFFPATLLTTLSGVLFGFWWGSLFTLIGENMSANLAYFIGRFFGKDSLHGEENSMMNNWKRKLSKDGFSTVLIMRFIFLPFDLVNFGCGILRVRWSSYAIATIIGIIPGAMTFIALGASVQNIEDLDFNSISLDKNQLFISAALFISSIVLAKYIKSKASRKNKKPLS